MARTIRTCSAVALLLIAGAAEAKRIVPSALGIYARARVAEGLRQPDAALALYRDALVGAPEELVVAFRAYRAAVDGGDYPLALRAAQALDRAGTLPPDARVLLYIAAVRERDWSAARARLIGMRDTGRDTGREGDRGEAGFGFLAPMLGAWLPGGDDRPEREAERPNAYSAENQALLALAQGRVAEGSSAVRALWSTDAYRATSLRIVAAATLGNRGDRDAALALLTQNDMSTAAMRQLVTGTAKSPLAVDNAARGAAFVLSRMAGDLISANTPRSAVTLARFATFADPANPRVALMAAGALAAAKRTAAARALVDRLRADPVYGDDAASLRIDLLEAGGEHDTALAEATARGTRSPNDRARVGDIEARRGNHAVAAGHYHAAITQVGADKAGWALWLAAGNAADQAGDWTAARDALGQALALAPDEPRVLNQLGFGMIERREDEPRAMRLIERASAAQPNNAAIVDSLGWAAFRLGQVDRAIGLLERARDLAVAEPEIGEHLGDAYWTAGRRIEARYAWRAAREVARDGTTERLDGKIARGLP